MFEYGWADERIEQGGETGTWLLCVATVIVSISRGDPSREPKIGRHVACAMNEAFWTF